MWGEGQDRRTIHTGRFVEVWFFRLLLLLFLCAVGAVRVRVCVCALLLEALFFCFFVPDCVVRTTVCLVLGVFVSPSIMTTMLRAFAARGSRVATQWQLQTARTFHNYGAVFNAPTRDRGKQQEHFPQQVREGMTVPPLVVHTLPRLFIPAFDPCDSHGFRLCAAVECAPPL